MQQIIRNILRSLALLIFASAVFGHEGKPHELDDLWYAWSFDPLVVIGLGVSALVYFIGLRNLWRESGRGHGISRWAAAAFAVGWVSMSIALVSPLHPWGEVLFSDDH